MALIDTLYKAYELINFLSKPPRTPLEKLAEYLKMSERNLRRYLQTLREFGYHIEQDHQNRYYLVWPEGWAETYPPESHPLALSRQVLWVRQVEIIQNLTTAIESQHQVILCSYHSASEKSQRDRLVFPYRLLHDDKYLMAYEPSAKSFHPFKIDRIQGIKWLDKTFVREENSPLMDVFGFSGPEATAFQLRLSSLAHRLLLEEFPHASGMIQRKRGNIYLKGKYCNPKGIGRFIMGLAGEVEIVEPVELQDFIIVETQKLLPPR
ncbi:MAG: WYL domain-containing transcriptional regulator [Bacteroidota bacterium]